MALPNKVREEMAKSFLAALNEGRIPWSACWKVARPQNAVTGVKYHGINAAFLSYAASALKYDDPRWCTFKQAFERGWHIQKGAKSLPVEYWAYYDTNQKKLLSWKEAGILLRDKEYADQYLILRSRTYQVFNGNQIDGIPKLDLQSTKTNIDDIRSQRDTLLKNMDLKYVEAGFQAYYSPSRDTVVLPPEHTFDDTYAYACTFLHECAHATGHPTRLNRPLTSSDDRESYAKEELRAEIASAFAAQAIGLQLNDSQLSHHMNLHKAYVQSWANVLSNSPEELFRAIKDADVICDYLIEKGEFLKEQTQELSAAPAAPKRASSIQELIDQLPPEPEIAKAPRKEHDRGMVK